MPGARFLYERNAPLMISSAAGQRIGQGAGLGPQRAHDRVDPPQSRPPQEALVVGHPCAAGREDGVGGLDGGRGQGAGGFGEAGGGAWWALA